MTDYALYVESGPRLRKTQVHVLALLGCIANGPTTPEALQATPQAIRTFLEFLHKHGEAADPTAAFTTSVAEHVTQGAWLGNGDPMPGFGPDFQPLTAADQELYVRRLAWLQADLGWLVAGLPPAQLAAEPAGGGRSIYCILLHLGEAHANFLRTTVGPVEGLNAATRALAEGSEPGLTVANLERVWQLCNARTALLSQDERTRAVPHGQVIVTARRGLRRMLEHTWEHLQEISRRFTL